jgi:calcineurin-like phosphoesterase family protein
MSRVAGKKWLVKGNHDEKTNHWYLNHGWDFVCDHFSDVYFGKRILFSHEPQAYDINLYDVNIHGHLHDNSRHGRPEDFCINGRICKLVAIEYTNYQPVTLESSIYRI